VRRSGPPVDDELNMDRSRDAHSPISGAGGAAAQTFDVPVSAERRCSESRGQSVIARHGERTKGGGENRR